MKLSVCCVVLFLLLHCATPKSLPSKSESAETELTTTTAAEVNATDNQTNTTPSVSTTASAPTATLAPTTSNATLSTAATPGTAVVSTFSPLQSFIHNVGYAFRIVMKLLAPLFGGQQKKHPVNPDQETEYEDFDDQNPEDDEDASRQQFAESFIRTVRQVTEQGRQNAGGISGYYDFIVNEYSYKFWAVYMLLASGLLIYSAIAAIYYAKFNVTAVDYEVYDEARSNGGASSGSNPLGLVGSLVSVRTFQTIMDAIANTQFDQKPDN